jgi:ABC-type oligopeptide transport system ATPase subunit
VAADGAELRVDTLTAVDLYRFFHDGDAEALALRGVSLSVAAGEMVALLGASGSGNSTLLNCLAGLDEPDGGHVDLLGERLTRRPEAERARRRAADVGILMQSEQPRRRVHAPHSTVTDLARFLGLWLRPCPSGLHIGAADVSLRRKPMNLRRLRRRRQARQARARHSTVTDLARFLGLCLRPALRALTSRRVVSLRRKPRNPARLRRLRPAPQERARHSTVTLLARLRGLSTSVPRAQAVW